MLMVRFLLDYFIWHRPWDTEMAITNIVIILLGGSVVGLLGWVINKARNG